jgi:sRNA-binding carbon storage regulator CsrA
MLVLSRRPDEKILLPTVPAVIKLISSQAGLARLGIEAPTHVPILRAELARQARVPADSHAVVGPAGAADPKLCHFVRDRINNLILGLTLLRMSLVERNPAVLETLAGMDEELQALRVAVAGSCAEPPGPCPQEALASPAPA